jgi:bacterioferritin-associated ferredoxin
MQLDEELCLCFHVTRRKVENYIRIERPQRVAQLSDCYGAGTGCGYCRPYLARLFKQCQGEQIESEELPAAQQYADMRTSYVHEGGGTPPPGATPIN